MTFSGPSTNAAADCERILRSLPGWFGIESALVGYAQATQLHPTFLVHEGNEIVAFLALRQHFAPSWEIHCMAVHANHRGKGIGRALHAHAETWLIAQGARFLQVKTMAASHPSPEYAETRLFYDRMGYSPVEIFPGLWPPNLPVLQMIKALPG